MQIRALKTFSGRLGLVRAGIVLTVDERYGHELIRSGLAIAFTPPGLRGLQPNLSPELNAALPGPPFTKADDLGNGYRDDGAPRPVSREDSPGARPGGGKGRRSSARRRARPSRKRT